MAPLSTLDLFALEADPAEPASASPPSRPLPRPARAARTAGPTTTQPPLLQPLTSPPSARVVSHSPMSDAAVPSDVLGLFAHPAAASTPVGRPVVVVSPRSFGSTASSVDPAHRDEASDPAGPGRGAALRDLARPGSERHGSALHGSERHGSERHGSDLHGSDLHDLAGPGSAGTGPIGEQGADRGADPTRPTVVPVPEPLAVVLPRGGLPRGGVVSLAGQGATSLLFSLLAGSRVQWAALVGMPGIGLAAAAEFGIDLDRLVVIPDPGEDVLQVLSVLVDGVEVVAVAAPKAPPPAGRLRVLNGRLRQRGAVLLVAGPWPGADITLTATLQGWTGLHQGHGRLRDRELLVQARGRGAAAQGREAVVLLRSDRRSVRVVPAVAVPATGTAATGTSGEQERPTAAMG
ncbi:hypothetical protein J2S58_000762 [Nakamurella flavida]|nr:hypothetical protein [Nakamurella flavida]